MATRKRTERDSETDRLQAQAEKIRWHHTMDLGHGVRTKGADNTPSRMSRIAFPSSLEGQTVLDVGAWDGFFSFEAERRGADRVLATDSFAWNGSCWGNKDGFNLARQTLGSKVEDREIDVLDLSPSTVGTFDVVLFLGVLYHLKNPLAALERMASVTKRMMIVESAVDMLMLRRPAMAFYPSAELGGDPTNWCGPNISCVKEMLRVAGFREVVCVHHYSFARRFAFATYSQLRFQKSFLPTLWQGRAAFHAFK